MKYELERSSDESQDRIRETSRFIEPISSRSRSESQASRKTSSTGGRVDSVGSENRTIGSHNSFVIACCKIRTMMSLPKITGYAILVLLAVVAFYSFYPYDPVRFNQLPIPVLNENNEVHQGESLFLQMDFEKSAGCNNIVAKYFMIDGFVLELNTQSITRPPGDNQFIREIIVPVSAPVGDSRHIRIEYSCQPNQIRTIYYQWDSEEFTVLPERSI